VLKLVRCIRLLPVMLAAATLLLGVKVHNVARGLIGQDMSASPIAEAHAEVSGRPAAAKQAAAPASAAPQDATSKSVAPAGHGDTAKAPPTAASTQPVPAATPSPLPSAQEIQVLQQLSARREALDARAEDVDRRSDLLRAGEARLDQKLQELKDLQSLLQGLLKSHDTQQEAQMRSLVKMYENMKPKDAARIFEELEMATLLQVAERMAERKLAPVMADMNPAKAKAITEELAKLRQLVSGAHPVGGG
jgi:flagellar motility protein MotE (MotC chaperone)